MSHARSHLVAFLVALGLLAGAAAGLSTAIRAFKFQITKKPIYPEDGRLLNSIPKESDAWVQEGFDRRSSPEIEEVLGTQNYISRMYREKHPKDPGNPIVLELHCAYYTGMIDTVPHVPDRCFLGGGMDLGEIAGNLPLPFDTSRWKPDDDVPDHLRGHIFTTRSASGLYPRLPADPHSMRLRTMKFLPKGGKPLYAGYFFIANGGTVCEAEGVRLLAFDLTSTYAYYLKVQVTAMNGVDSPQALAHAAASLLDDFVGDLMLCTPDWVKVQTGEYPAGSAGAPGSP